nr:hypothetical protein CFP56_62699 [Quercus suber]
MILLRVKRESAENRNERNRVDDRVPSTAVTRSRDRKSDQFLSLSLVYCRGSVLLCGSKYTLTTVQTRSLILRHALMHGNVADETIRVHTHGTVSAESRLIVHQYTEHRPKCIGQHPAVVRQSHLLSHQLGHDSSVEAFPAGC